MDTFADKRSGLTVKQAVPAAVFGAGFCDREHGYFTSSRGASSDQLGHHKDAHRGFRQASWPRN